MATVDELFTKRIPVTVKFSDRENRRVGLNLSIEIHTLSTPVHRKELVVRLTDESDLFFLYSLHLSEEDFQSLKSQQGLLVDFASFPQKFVDLLELCLQDEHKESPKFILEFVANGSGAGCTANLNVIETNPFKYLTHLSLKFQPGTDTDVKKYLASCLKILREQNGSLLSRLEQMEADLSHQLRQAREALSTRSQELDTLKSEWTAKTSDITVKHRQEVTSEREKALQTQVSTQQRFEREKRELEQAHTKIVKELESKLYELESARKDLTDRKYKSESIISELRNKLSLLEEEQVHNRQELQTMRKNNAGLDSNSHEQEKTIQQLRMRLAVLEQEVKDKEEVDKRNAELHAKEKEQKRSIKEEMEQMKKKMHQLNGSVKTLSEELIKANGIIKKLQSEIKTYHSRLKVRNQVTTEQEKVLGEKNKEMEEIRKELEQVKVTLSSKDTENKKLNENLETAMQKLEESREHLKTNENVIQWLNKQLTENQLHRPNGPGAFEMNSAASVTGSAHRGIHNYSAPSYHGSHSHQGTPSLGSYQPHYNNSSRHVHYQQQRTAGPAPLAKSSPVGSIPEERRDPQASPVLTGSNGHSVRPSLSSDPILDNKYLQRSSEASLRTGSRNPHSPPTSGSIHFTPTEGSTAAVSMAMKQQHLGGPSIPAASNPSRLSRDVVVPRTLQGSRPVNPQSQTPPPLASAYFPNPAKVT